MTSSETYRRAPNEQSNFVRDAILCRSVIVAGSSALGTALTLSHVRAPEQYDFKLPSIIEQHHDLGISPRLHVFFVPQNIVNLGLFSFEA
jgi:hypothetical protein